MCEPIYNNKEEHSEENYKYITVLNVCTRECECVWLLGAAAGGVVVVVVLWWSCVIHIYIRAHTRTHTTLAHDTQTHST